MYWVLSFGHIVSAAGLALKPKGYHRMQPHFFNGGCPLMELAIAGQTCNWTIDLHRWSWLLLHACNSSSKIFCKLNTISIDGASSNVFCWIGCLIPLFSLFSSFLAMDLDKYLNYVFNRFFIGGLACGLGASMLWNRFPIGESKGITNASTKQAGTVADNIDVSWNFSIYRIILPRPKKYLMLTVFMHRLNDHPYLKQIDRNFWSSSLFFSFSILVHSFTEI